MSLAVSSPLGVSYAYVLRPELAIRWKEVDGREVQRVSVTAFGAEVSGQDPVLDPQEHDALTWCSYHQADRLLDWGPIEPDALAGRRKALSVLYAQLQTSE
jgi:hypothetical protein